MSSSRQLLVIFSLAATALSGCVTPVVTGPNRFGIGLYAVEDRQVTEEIRHTKIKGVGLLYANGRISIGYCDFECVVAQLLDKSYRARTPLASIAVGEEAEIMALDFVSEVQHQLEEKGGQ